MAAMRRSPSKLELPRWLAPSRNFGYLAEVQPVFDRQCVSCHDYGKDAGKKLNLAGDLGALFNTSYVDLRAKDFVHVVDAGPPEVQMPKSWGPHASRLIAVLLGGHANRELDRQVKLTPEDIERVITWINLNAPYYPEYAGGAYRANFFGRCPLDDGMLKRVEQLTGLPHDRDNIMTAFNFTRPELSLCLNRIADHNDSRYVEVVKIIQSGKEKLARDPRPDMPGFRLTDPAEIAQQCKYDTLQKTVTEVQAKIRREKQEGH